jgi:hypothetical protein
MGRSCPAVRPSGKPSPQRLACSIAPHLVAICCYWLLANKNCQDWESQRELALSHIDKGGFGYWTVFVAGAGFLTDAYNVRQVLIPGTRNPSTYAAFLFRKLLV